MLELEARNVRAARSRRRGAHRFHVMVSSFALLRGDGAARRFIPISSILPYILLLRIRNFKGKHSAEISFEREKWLSFVDRRSYGEILREKILRGVVRDAGIFESRNVDETRAELFDTFSPERKIAFEPLGFERFFLCASASARVRP